MENKNDDIKALYETIRNNHVSGRYIINLYLINNYLERGYAVFDWILEAYITSLIKSNKIKEAKENLSNIRKFFPNILSDYRITVLYIMCEDYNEVFDILNNPSTIISDNQYSKLGIILLADGQYSMAKDCFMKAINITDDIIMKNKCINWLKQIDDHFTNNTFICQNYKIFKESGKKILPGHIITGVINSRKASYEEKDRYNKRLQIVLEINDNKVFCVPIINFHVMNEINKPEFKKTLILKENYPFLNDDAIVTDKIENIHLDNIKLVYGRLLPEDFVNIYHTVTASREEFINSKKLFKIKK